MPRALGTGRSQSAVINSVADAPLARIPGRQAVVGKGNGWMGEGLEGRRPDRQCWPSRVSGF